MEEFIRLIREDEKLMREEEEHQPNVDAERRSELMVDAEQRSELMVWTLDLIRYERLSRVTTGHILSLIDRALKTTRKNLALVGISCVLIGSKLHEVTPCTVDSFVDCVHPFTRDDITRTESALETALGVERVVTPHQILQSALKCMSVPPRVEKLCFDLLDALASGKNACWWLGQRRSIHALSALVVSLQTCGEPFPEELSKLLCEVSQEAVDENCVKLRPLSHDLRELAYVLDKFRGLLERESELQPAWLENRISDYRRSKIMVWILEWIRCEDWGRETTGLILSLVDRVLFSSVSRFRPVLVGLVCMLIGSKFSGGTPLCLKGKVFQSGGNTLITPEDIVSAESEILDVLEWHIYSVTSHHILECVAFLLPEDVKLVCDELLGAAASGRDVRWWLGPKRSTHALSAVMASLQICGAQFPEFECFLCEVDSSAVHINCSNFLALYESKKNL